MYWAEWTRFNSARWKYVEALVRLPLQIVSSRPDILLNHIGGPETFLILETRCNDLYSTRGTVDLVRDI